MTNEALQAYLHEHIPLSRAMGVQVVASSVDAVTLGAPLAPNINHRDTVFGGSASAVATLAAWSLLHVRLSAEGLPSRLVIQRNSMDYLHPVAGDFTATASLEGDWAAFTRMLARKGVARIAVRSQVDHAGEMAGAFRGEFVAFGGERE
ncbi:YiiD C-terminal domain-containing protein [Devosia sp. 1566]|uniref:YiiD C-terminal domain-containing protein n=1 Tax=Devosia sp. 1566 TaxID=2499144 RepID=UPI000FD7C624|nr:YiiD C-terminal domain-containing protein [Devosia sp. 1566]